ncbi:MAG: hypothetical protein LBU74_07925 [Methanobacteriaceae archaeon]|nr:hypothetical protein [Candidatus Methanorudis spinitermitis]
MGYYIFSYGIDTDKIKSIFGSNNENIFESIKKTDTFEHYKDFLPKGFKTSPERALEDIIRNRQYDENSGFAYGYAIICISVALGEKLPYTQEIKLGYETDLIDKYLDENFAVADFTLDDILFEEIHPFNIPLIDDWPIIGICYKRRLKELQDILKDVKISEEYEVNPLDMNAEYDDSEFMYMHIKGLKENIDYCIENNLDMINFCH